MQQYKTSLEKEGETDSQCVWRSNATDIEAAFNTLRDGSHNHYWAFDKMEKKKDANKRKKRVY